MRFRFLLCLTLILGGNFGRAAVGSGVTNKDEFPLITVATFGTNDGVQSVGSLVLGADGALYGVTEYGGASVRKENRLGYGTVFRVTTNGVLTTLFSFQGTNGANPKAGLAVGDHGYFYGVTYAGGTHLGGGVGFRISTNGEEKVLHYFGGGDGWDNGIRATRHLQQWQGCGTPVAALILSKDGDLYGTTPTGAFDYGTVFKMTTNGDLNYIFAFDRTNGYLPSAELSQDEQGNLYGTTHEGGPNGRSHGGYGTLFKIDSSGKLLWYFGFNGTNGLHPRAGLVKGPDGSFYGSTYGGWYTDPDSNEMAQNDGTIFRLTTNGVLTTLVSFVNTNGACPLGRLVFASDGNFYGVVRFYNGVGMASDSPMGNGAIFQMSPQGRFRIVAVIGDGDFNIHPAGGLTEGLEGDLYGVTDGGGPSRVFKLRVRTRHYGDAAPLRAALLKLDVKVRGLSEARFRAVSLFGDNSLTVDFTNSIGSQLMIVAKAYDSDEMAKTGLETDQKWISVHWNEKPVIDGVDVYEYTNYGRVDFQVGPYTFNLTTIRHGNENVQPLLRKVSSVLIGEFKP